MVRAAAVSALAPTIAITHSLMATRWWNRLFAVAGLSAFGFAVWASYSPTRSTNMRLEGQPLDRDRRTPQRQRRGREALLPLPTPMSVTWNEHRKWLAAASGSSHEQRTHHSGLLDAEGR